MQLLNKTRKLLLLAMPIALFFSYHPVIKLGSNDYMNFELSIAELWLVCFFLANLPRIKELAKFYELKKIIVAMLLPFFFSLSIIWSENHLRATLTAGIFWLIVFAGLNIIYLLKKDKSLSPLLQKSLLLSAAAVSVFCLAQCVLDLAGVSQAYTLMCDGCVYSSFGFPHPNGFAIEPQFMGNLLLAPALLSFYLLATKNYLYKKPVLIGLLILVTTTLFITLSRGAIYAFIIALIFQQVYLKIKSRSKINLLKSAGLLVLTFLLAISVQGTFAAVSRTSDTFYSGITKSIHQLSLGKIDLRPVEVSAPAETSAEVANFSGYVEESTNTRMDLNKLAIKTWASNPRYMIIGTGLGSAGISMHQYAPETIGPKEIVQNEYLSLLLETGFTGYAIITAVVIFTLRRANKKVLASPLFLSAVLGFSLTLLFFSGLPNAINLYLFPLIFIFATKDHSIVAEKV